MSDTPLTDAARREMEITTGYTWHVSYEFACKLESQKNKLRTALVGLVGADGKEELDGMEMFIRINPHAPENDRVATINAIHALRETLP